MDFFSTNNILVHIPLGANGYALSWVEALGTLSGLVCIWLASLEKTENYLFGLVNVSLFALIFFQIQLYASLLLQIFFLAANVYGWYVWSRITDEQEAELRVRWLARRQALWWIAGCVIVIVLMSCYIDPFFALLTQVAVALMQAAGLDVAMPTLQPDAFPFWDSAMTVLSVAAMLLMTRKYVENWLLWVAVDIISVVIFAHQGVYAMSLQYMVLTLISLNGSWLWIKGARDNHSRPLARAL
ncbi:Nicotinamide riboside transporter PnuC [Dickeya dianthicola]|uniref:Nicotinamide riboside transporter PnuC n=1 Tax=Dickeya dianthicola TaxID=204039 RepID=A0AAP2CYK0_9GAMM|nr:nicotinamide riboside transporter PnuC [Dickeya dianthicola]ATO32245.1 Ribosyl nicotinamide transporter, PnuC-like [Dickeya dianthicola RNS04.9]AYC18239.1 Nicotinamide riboside transporter PnuC [Dickeya dianthicola]MBI0437136.1 nicotinamide riboside transporter PnuC [Dickeya dianthicola]MBI0447709.1 nicotinamide riboside transporter PnuC [Dickeya dianthicola]MBI0452326.1 nicotinamide riboside transporter PnuC [Dickeya dianthicola]